VLLRVGTTVHLRLSFTYPPEVHSLVGTVTWASSDARKSGEDAYRCGVRWLDVGYTLRRRLRQLVNSAIPRSRGELYLFASHWVVRGEWPPQRPTRLVMLKDRDWLGFAEDDGTATLPPVARLQLATPAGEHALVEDGNERSAAVSCASCRILRQGQLEYGWPVGFCGECLHYRYGTPGLCACRPQHGDPEPFERMLQAEVSSRQRRSAVPSGGLPTAARA
jgi:hypothetical protein